MTDAAIFKHYNSMDGIIMAIINDYVSRCSKSAEIGIARGKTLEDKLRHVLKAQIEVLEDTKGAVPILCFDFSRSDKKKFTKILHSFVQDYKKRLPKVIEEGQIQGVIREAINPEDAAMFFLGSIQAKVFAKVIEQREGPVIPDPDLFISELFYGMMKR